ncbi:hypothetical protein [Nocardioides rubriscoriae]|uniref:hypothetical protein n=1 Tax=Nocardioides rubriscoriae TaxID=642762 RepID=UPI0011DF9F28|nr:hypothetical protein [Nocardioides rubriscoriae]
MLRRSVGALKLGVAATVALLAVGPVVAAAQGATGPVPGPGTSVDAAQAELDALMVAHDCSRTGFGADVIPGSALVERDGRVEQVSFDDGWAIYTGDADGSLLAVCRSTL